MSIEEHLVENAIIAYKKNHKDYHEGFDSFDIKLNQRQVKELFGSTNLESLYEIIIAAYEFDK